MNATSFLILLSSFSVINGLAVEGIKNIAADKTMLPYNIIALVSALIIGGVGTGVYYQLNAIPFSVNNIIYLTLMGFASAICSMTSYDKVKQAITQILAKQ